MISDGDIADIVFDVLSQHPLPIQNFREWIERPGGRQGKWGVSFQKPYNKGYTALPASRLFLSEFDIKKLLGKNPKQLRIPKQSILSPLAEEWLKEKKVAIIYE